MDANKIEAKETIPASKKLGKAKAVELAKAASRVVVYTHKDPARLIKQWSGEKIHRAAELEVHSFDRSLIAAFVARITRRMAFSLSVTGGHLYIGHSERLSGEGKDRFENTAITTYRHKGRI